MGKTYTSIKKYILKFGIILGILWVSYSFIRYTTNNIGTNNWMFSMIELFIKISIVVYGIYSFKSENKGFLKLVQGLKIGLGIVLIGTVIQLLWEMVLYKIIEPELIEELFKSNFNPEKISNDNVTSKEYVASEKNKILFAMFQITIIGNLILGLLTSLLGGAILQNNPDPFDLEKMN